MSSTLSIGMQIHRLQAWLGPELLRRADAALSGHEDRKFSGAVADAGACLEGILKRVLRDGGENVEAVATLGPLIGALRKSGRAPSALLDRLNEANTIRNRAPHDKTEGGRLTQITEGDSLQILTIVGLVVDWCASELGENDVPAATDAFPVFLSVGGPHRLDQWQFLQNLRSRMRALGVEFRTITPSMFSKDRPFEQIREVMVGCRAALVVGLDRSHAYAMFEREASDRQRLHKDIHIPTVWNHIEGSIASALGQPVLVLRERRLNREGIFEAENHGHQIRDFDLAHETAELSEELRAFVAGWIASVRSAPAKNR